MKREVRVRFAPSPTGYLHVGGARTALFNYLYARKHNGKFILRIEDTDFERSTGEAMHDILLGLKWLGLEWDEGPQRDGDAGPYFQSQRLETYSGYARELERKGLAYRCYCTPEQLKSDRQAAGSEGREYRYGRGCSALTAEERAGKEASGMTFVLRFAIPEGITVVDDIIRGAVSFDNSLLDDFVIVKTDGMATYNFAVVVDDALMGITDVIRGEDHLSNTPRQILLYRALGFDLPRFAHIPLILGPDKARLSKRHGATALTGYRDDGILPQAMINFLALLGWGCGDRQIFSKSELSELFELERVNKNPAVFDIEKLEWMNGCYMREMDDDELFRHTRPYLTAAGLLPEEPDEALVSLAKQAVKLNKDRLRYLRDITELTAFFFSRPAAYEPGPFEKWFSHPQVADRLESLTDNLESLEPFTAPELERIVRHIAVVFEVKAGEIIHPVRLALTGRSVSPGLFETMEALGRGECKARLLQAIDIIRAHNASGGVS